jgi:hypothetical protein
MKSDITVRVCIQGRQYQRALIESGLSHYDEFNLSIGLRRPMHPNNEKIPYVINGGIPMGSYEELIIVDEKLFNYSKIKYELYN